MATLKLKNIKEVRRFTISDERRTRAYLAPSGTTRNINGYFAVTNQPSKLMAELDNGEIRIFNEVILPGAFARVLASPDLDCILCIDHFPSSIISRTRAGTLRLKEDDYGLLVDSDTVNTTICNDLLANIEVNNYTENSFCFIVGPDGEYWDTVDGIDTRFITSFSALLDVSCVINPAYNGTSLSVRGMEVLKNKTVGESEDNIPVTMVPIVETLNDPADSLDIFDVDLFILKNK